MSITTTIDQSQRRILSKAEGAITLEDIRAHVEAEHRILALSYMELIDARGSTPAFSPDEVRAIVDLLRRRAAESRLGPAAIIIDTDFGYGMLRMLEMLVEDVCAIRPFRTKQEAEQWLAEVAAQAQPVSRTARP